MVCLVYDFKILLTVFNQSYNCQTSHYLSRHRLPKPFLILPSLEREIDNLNVSSEKISLGIISSRFFVSHWDFCSLRMAVNQREVDSLAVRVTIIPIYQPNGILYSLRTIILWQFWDELIQISTCGDLRKLILFFLKKKLTKN